MASATILQSIIQNSTQMSSYQELSESWDSHTDPYSIQPYTSKLTLSILNLFSSGSVPTK